MTYQTTTEPTRRHGRHAAPSVWDQPAQLLQTIQHLPRLRPPQAVFAVVVLLAISIVIVAVLSAR
ncbi:hypothetical protein ONA91_33700 [Micromonospora sp. DR5-3]|uniref:hypothetical protein n=1 Tax=unclassified Micromonospora TaxID=2617518 RepID=UPI001651B1D3|nr:MULTISPECIES: hypothetical protein [unclassified Micromonospora]MCW3819409.1 hypothetical protein [Micromonospora sp. DR5-3]